MKHLNFIEGFSKSGKTKLITVLSEHDDYKLGEISWCFGWRQYVFLPNVDTQWSHDCLEDLKNFIVQLNKEHKECVGVQK
jgi:hypothetical protein